MAESVMVKLGLHVRDQITRFEGIVVGRTEYLYGCTQIMVQARKLGKDGKPLAEWFDEPGLDVIGHGMEPETSEKTGGPRSAPTTKEDGR